MTTLSEKSCRACISATRPLTRVEFEPLAAQLSNWQVLEDHTLRRSIKTKNFAKAPEHANLVGAIAEAEGHHPDLLVRWGALRIDIWTHKVDGLTEADFVLAAKIDAIIP